MKRHKKSRIITYFLSFLPGAGFLYRGYMKRGISYMAFFLFSLVVADGLQWSGICVMSILIWFYAFFDQINTLSQIEENDLKKDEIILYQQLKKVDGKFLNDHSRSIGGVMFITGSYLLVKNTYLSILVFLPESVEYMFVPLLDYLPNMVLASILLYFGVCCLQKNEKVAHAMHMISEKKMELSKENNIGEANVVYYMEKTEQIQDKIPEIVAMKEAVPEIVTTNENVPEDTKHDDLTLLRS